MVRKFQERDTALTEATSKIHKKSKEDEEHMKEVAIRVIKVGTSIITANP